jgi:hypothetical protein
MTDAMERILSAGASAGAQSILFLVVVMLVWGLYSGHVEIGPQLTERKQALERCTKALAEMQIELTDAKATIARLETKLYSLERKG